MVGGRGGCHWVVVVVVIYGNFRFTVILVDLGPPELKLINAFTTLR